MEEQLLEILNQTQSSADAPRKQAERRLQELYTNEASHKSVPTNLRQSAILVLKTFVQSTWSTSFDEFKRDVPLSDATRTQVRETILSVATSNDEGDERKVKAAASYVVSKIASADFPDQWPALLPTVLHLIPTGSPSQVHGSLKVLSDLVEEGLNEDQFFKVARDLVKIVYDVAVDGSRKATLRALAVSIFRSCFDSLEMVMDTHRAEIKGFAEEALSAWLPFFIEIMKMPLPPTPSEDQDGGPQEEWRGLIALKLQVVKTLMKVRSVFPALLSPQSPVLFSTTWQELSTLQEPYRQLYINDERQGRLEDADGLPYTLDFLVLEELDFMQACLRAPPVRKELEAQLQAQNGAEPQHTSWLTEMMKVAVAYAQITTEEEGLWEIDVNIFLSEETSVTANYTPRTACGDLIIKLGEWLQTVAADGLLQHARAVFSGEQQSWKSKEAVLYVLNQLLGDFLDVNRTIGPELSHGFAEFINYAQQQSDMFLRARGHLAAGVLTRTSGEALQHIGPSFLHQTLKAIGDDDSEVVKVACIRVLQDYIQCLPAAVVQPLQTQIISAISTFSSTQDPDDLGDSDDLMVTLVESLRDSIRVDPRICITPGSGALDLLFTLASRGANNFQLTMLVNETFEDIVYAMAKLGSEAYIQLCEKVLPSLIGAFDVGSLTGENSLTNLAADLLAILAAHGSSPLPQGFVATIMPKLQRLLLNSTDGELLRPGTETVKSMLLHDAEQVFNWRDNESGKSGLEVCLAIIGRLLQESIDDHAAAEVGGLAAQLVERAGSERLGPFLLDLLRAVAVRLASAEQAAFIQSLILVFARLCLVGPQDVVDFLAQVRINGANGEESGLQVVMSKWLENSSIFAGYEEIRQNVIALSKLYSLNDPRLAQIMVTGDLIVPQSDRIMTRSRTKQTPDQYTIIPLPLKILKLLLAELSFPDPTPTNPLSQSGTFSPHLLTPHRGSIAGISDHHPSSEPHNAEDHDSDADSADADNNTNDGDWEDVPSTLDLGLHVTKQELMAYGAAAGHDGSGDSGLFGQARQRDDETQGFLVQFLREVPRERLEVGVEGLTQRERAKLGSVVGGGV
ncbi:MAG: hypothetical protein M1817_005391 [Caeruleum heppii]|nr:MAG: hypothetical protein M1817_005391 [Caeruleum heppii]